MELITGDTHLGQYGAIGENGIIEGRRGFSSVEEMNNTIIQNWNSVVTPNDTVYHVGDVSLNMSPEATFGILKQLNGHIILILGNHESENFVKYLKKHNYLYNRKPKFVIEEVGVRKKIDGKFYYLSHYPISLGNTRSKVRNLCGHIHELSAFAPNALNIGVDSPEIPELPFGTPITLQTAVDLVEKKWTSYADFMKISHRFR